MALENNEFCCYRKVGSGCSALKSQWTCQVGGKKNLHYFRCWQLRGRSDICPKASSPPWHTHTNKQGIKNFIDRERGLRAETAQSALTVILKLVMWWSDKCYLDCFIFSWLIGKDPDAGKDWGQEEKGMTEDETAGWHHWLDGRWVWVNSGSWWWTGRPGVLRFMGSQRVRHDWATELNWTEAPETF